MTFLLVLVALLLALLMITLVLWIGRSLLFAWPMLHGPVFVPSKEQDIASMIELAQLRKKDRAIDLGSGDGAILAAVARRGYRIEGCEINPVLVWQSRQRLAAESLQTLATVRRQNFWTIDFSEYDVVFLYGTSYIMQKLERKVRAELKPGARIVSNYFQFPSWVPARSEGKIRCYVQPATETSSIKSHTAGSSS